MAGLTLKKKKLQGNNFRLWEYSSGLLEQYSHLKGICSHRIFCDEPGIVKLSKKELLKDKKKFFVLLSSASIVPLLLLRKHGFITNFYVLPTEIDRKKVTHARMAFSIQLFELAAIAWCFRKHQSRKDYANYFAFLGKDIFNKLANLFSELGKGSSFRGQTFLEEFKTQFAKTRGNTSSRVLTALLRLQESSNEEFLNLCMVLGERFGTNICAGPKGGEDAVLVFDYKVYPDHFLNLPLSFPKRLPNLPVILQYSGEQESQKPANTLLELRQRAVLNTWFGAYKEVPWPDMTPIWFTSSPMASPIHRTTKRAAGLIKEPYPKSRMTGWTYYGVLEHLGFHSPHVLLPLGRYDSIGVAHFFKAGILKKGCKVIEIGCGPEFIAALSFKRYGAERVTMVDFVSPEYVSDNADPKQKPHWTVEHFSKYYKGDAPYPFQEEALWQLRLRFFEFATQVYFLRLVFEKNLKGLTRGTKRHLNEHRHELKRKYKWYTEFLGPQLFEEIAETYYYLLKDIPVECRGHQYPFPLGFIILSAKYFTDLEGTSVLKLMDDMLLHVAMDGRVAFFLHASNILFKQFGMETIPLHIDKHLTMIKRNADVIVLMDVIPWLDTNAVEPFLKKLKALYPAATIVLHSIHLKDDKKFGRYRKPKVYTEKLLSDLGYHIVRLKKPFNLAWTVAKPAPGTKAIKIKEPTLRTSYQQDLKKLF